MKGSMMCTDPMSTEGSLKSSVNGRSMMPSDFMAALSGPLRPRMIIQAKVRTSSLVHNGRTTEMMSNPAALPRACAST